MVFCCFGRPGSDGKVNEHGRQQAYTVPAAQLSAKEADSDDAPVGPAKTPLLPVNTTSLSAATAPDTRSGAFQLSVLNAAVAGLAGGWHERLAAAATRLATVSGATLCTVSILDPGQERFTVVHVTGKDPCCSTWAPAGSQLPALQAGAPSAHLAGDGGGLRYNSAQVLQLLQTPLMYSFTDSSHGTTQPPHDWQAMHETHGLSDFCALPLTQSKAVLGAVTLAFDASSDARRQQPQQNRSPAQSGPSSPSMPPLMLCDEQSVRMLGLLLSVMLLGQDVYLAQQVAEILSGVYEARTLQQVVTVVSAGAEQVLQLTTRVAVAANLAVVAGPGGGGSAAGAAGSTQPLTAGPLSSNGMGRAIFFEERSGGSRPDGSTQGTNGSRSIPGVGEPSSGMGAYAAGYPQRHLRHRVNASVVAEVGSNGQPPNMLSPRQKGAAPSGAGTGSLPNISGRINAASMSHDGTSQANGSQGGLLWQAGLVQARALGLRQTLLANLPADGTVIHDCASYMQQVGCPKRDLYLLSTCQGAAPFSLAIAPAPLKEGEPSLLVLYVAVPMRLPMELLSEILTQARQLALHVLAPLLQQKLVHGNLADEWSLLLGKCVSGRNGPAAAAAANGASPDARPGSSAIDGPAAASGATASQAAGSSAAEARQSSAEGSSETVGGVSGTAPSAAGTTATLIGTSNMTPRGRHPQLPAGLMAPTADGARTGAASSMDMEGAGSRLLAPTAATSQESYATVLSTAVGGAFAGDTRTHMGMLVSSFKDTINALQATRADEAEELSVLKLGKVLGRGGSGLVFQGYLHLGLEVAVKLFENPDDTDPEAAVEDGLGNLESSLGPDAGSTAGGDGSSAAASKAGTKGDGASPKSNAAPGGGATGGKDQTMSSTGGGTMGASKDSSLPALAQRNAKAAAQMTKRQRDLLRNALELGVTSSLSHPNIVQGYCHWVNVVLMQDASLNRCWLMGQSEYMALAPPGSPPPPLCSALVMEYCDMGSLIHALKRGTFNGSDGKPNMEYIYMCLLEMALALRHLHTAKLAHCDLKPGNVMLRSSPRDPRGFVCKLGDFGYAAILKEGLLPGRPAVLPDEACGTLQYMAPELFVAGRPVDASIDIYAFGMLMWELIMGKTPYSDTEYGSRALMKAVYHGKRPSFPESTLPSYKNLAMCCWSGDPSMRPTASVLVKLLRQQLESLKSQGSAPIAATGSTTSKT